MRELRLQPVPDEAALLVEPKDDRHPKWVVIADLHLGLGAPERQPLGPPESSAPALAESLIDLAVRSGARTILVAGDVKHPIVGTPRPLRPVIFDFFSTILSAGLNVEVILGNHDVGLVRHLPKEVEVHSASGIVRDGVGIFHGHRWPSKKVLRAERLVVGHLHPGYRFAATADDASSKKRCWVHVEYPPPGTARRKVRPALRELQARELTVLPAFNPLTGTESLNIRRPKRSRSFLFQRFLAPGEARAYLLDGTDLGRLVKTGERRRRSGSSRKVSPAR